MKPDRIAVSKPCCPVCWEFLELLKATTFPGAPLSESYQVRSRHTELVPVELPPETPVAVLEGMIKRFRRFLLVEFNSWLRDACTAGHSRDFSVQSDSGLSTMSDASNMSQ